MNEHMERGIFVAVILGLSVVLVSESQAQVEIERKIPLDSKGLYAQIASGDIPQIIDVRPLEDDSNEDVGGYLMTHIPGSIPFPNCDESATPEGALGQIQMGVPTVIVSAEGELAAFEKCSSEFSRARNLGGGMVDWMDNFLPEDEGVYAAPMVGAGGGCL